MVDFAGWAMPIHYGSQIEEHHAVRTAAGMFDVSHMTVIDIISDVAESFLQYLLANNVARLKHGQALYSCMLNDDGGVIDDLIVYFIKRGFYRMVVNAATREKDLAWINQIADKFNITPQERADVSMIAVQGPQAIERSLPFLPESLKNQAAELHRFQACLNDKYCVARTGYTGEDGFEVMLPSTEVEKFWAAFAENGIRPAGLGARDTLRLEAGMNLYGNDMDESVTPLESGLAWTVAWEPQDRNFVGRTALEKQRKAGVAKKLVGLKLTDRGVLRAHQKVYSSAGEGEITSGTFSPTLKQTIAMARVPKDMGSACEVEIRSKRLAAEVVKYPFVRDGKSMID
jgi:aminomethyltransferase